MWAEVSVPYVEIIMRQPISSTIYKERIVGDWEVNGTEPPYVWQIGSGPSAA